MKNYDRLTLNEVANAYRNMILDEAAGPPRPPRPPKPPKKPHVFKPADQYKPLDPNWYPIPAPELEPGDHSGFPKDPRFVSPENPKGYWKWHDRTQGWKPSPLAPPQPRPPKPGLRPILRSRGAGVAGGLLTLLSLYSIYQDLFGDDGTEVDVIPDDGQVIKPVNTTPNLDLQPLYVPPHQRDPRNYPGQHPVRPPKSPAGGSQGSGGGIGGGGGMGM